MAGNLRISTFSGALLAAYFIPAWTKIAFQIMISPIHGLYERPNVSMALFVSDHLHLTGMATVRFAWLLALGRMTVVAFLAMFLVLIARASVRKSGGGKKPGQQQQDPNRQESNRQGQDPGQQGTGGR